jgi:hypothetical protein
MKIDIKTITDGSMDGVKMWVCDFRQTDLHKKPIRNVQPTHVIVCPASDISDDVYYSQSFMRPLSKKDGTPLSKVIKVFDNTGYRSYTGIALTAFTTEAECREHFAIQCDVVIEQLELVLANVAKTYQREIDILTKRKEIK